MDTFAEALFLTKSVIGLCVAAVVAIFAVLF